MGLSCKQSENYYLELQKKSQDRFENAFLTAGKAAWSMTKRILNALSRFFIEKYKNLREDSQKFSFKLFFQETFAEFFYFCTNLLQSCLLFLGLTEILMKLLIFFIKISKLIPFSEKIRNWTNWEQIFHEKKENIASEKKRKQGIAKFNKNPAHFKNLLNKNYQNPQETDFVSRDSSSRGFFNFLSKKTFLGNQNLKISAKVSLKKAKIVENEEPHGKKSREILERSFKIKFSGGRIAKSVPKNEIAPEIQEFLDKKPIRIQENESSSSSKAKNQNESMRELEKLLNSRSKPRNSEKEMEKGQIFFDLAEGFPISGNRTHPDSKFFESLIPPSLKCEYLPEKSLPVSNFPNVNEIPLILEAPKSIPQSNFTPMFTRIVCHCEINSSHTIINNRNDRFLIYCKRCCRVLPRLKWSVDFWEIEKNEVMMSKEQVRNEVEIVFNFEAYVPDESNEYAYPCHCFFSRPYLMNSEKFMIFDRTSNNLRELHSIFSTLQYNSLAELEFHCLNRKICPKFALFECCSGYRDKKCFKIHAFANFHKSGGSQNVENPIVFERNSLKNANLIKFEYNETLRQEFVKNQNPEEADALKTFNPGGENEKGQKFKDFMGFFEEKPMDEGDCLRKIPVIEKKKFLIDKYLAKQRSKNENTSNYFVKSYPNRRFCFAVDENPISGPELRRFFIFRTGNDNRKYTAVTTSNNLQEIGNNSQILQFLDPNLKLISKIRAERPIYSIFASESNTFVCFFYSKNICNLVPSDFKSILHEKSTPKLFGIRIPNLESFSKIKNPKLPMFCFETGFGLKSRICCATSDVIFEIEIPENDLESFRFDDALEFAQKSKNCFFTTEIITSCFHKSVISPFLDIVLGDSKSRYTESSASFSGCNCAPRGFFLLSLSLGHGHAIIAINLQRSSGNCKKWMKCVFSSTNSNFSQFPKHSRILKMKYDSIRDLVWVLVAFSSNNNRRFGFRFYFFDLFTECFVPNSAIDVETTKIHEVEEMKPQDVDFCVKTGELFVLEPNPEIQIMKSQKIPKNLLFSLNLRAKDRFTENLLKRSFGFADVNLYFK